MFLTKVTKVVLNHIQHRLGFHLHHHPQGIKATSMKDILLLLPQPMFLTILLTTTTKMAMDGLHSSEPVWPHFAAAVCWRSAASSRSLGFICIWHCHIFKIMEFGIAFVMSI